MRLRPEDTQETNFEKLDSSNLQYLLINAVKELYQKTLADAQDMHAQIESQQKQIDELKAVVCQGHPSAAVCQGQ